MADPDLQSRSVHPEDFANVYLHDSQGGYQDYARLNQVKAFRQETFANSQALFILKEYRDQKSTMKTLIQCVKAFFGDAIGGILTGKKQFELPDVIVEMEREVQMVPAFMVFSSNVQPTGTDSHYSVVKMVAMAGLFAKPNPNLTLTLTLALVKERDSSWNAFIMMAWYPQNSYQCQRRIRWKTRS